MSGRTGMFDEMRALAGEAAERPHRRAALIGSVPFCEASGDGECHGVVHRSWGCPVCAIGAHAEAMRDPHYPIMDTDTGEVVPAWSLANKRILTHGYPLPLVPEP